MRIQPGAEIDAVISKPGRGANTINSIDVRTVGTSKTFIVGADSDRVELFVKAAASNAGLIYIGDFNITDPASQEQGIPLAAGEAATLQSSDLLYAFADTVGQKLYVMELLEL